MHSKGAKHENLCKFLNALYLTKNKKYGDSFGLSVRKYGPIAALTRLSDKWNRLENLMLHNDDGTADESLRDTLIDMANYCLMTIIELEDMQHNDTDRISAPCNEDSQP